MNADVWRGPSPWARVACVTIVGIAATLSRDFYALGILALVLAAVIAFNGQAAALRKFALRFWLPMTVSLFAIWGVVVRGNPLAGYHAGAAAGMEFAAVGALRILVLAMLFQAAILSLRGLEFVAFLKRLGVSPSGTAIVVSTMNLTPEFGRRIEQVVAARCARGYMPDRKLSTRLRQLPWTLRTVFVGALHASLERAQRWQDEALPERLVGIADAVTPRRKSGFADLGWTAVSAVWSYLAIFNLPHPW